MTHPLHFVSSKLLHSHTGGHSESGGDGGKDGDGDVQNLLPNFVLVHNLSCEL